MALNEMIDTISDGWYSCESYYTFIENHIGLSGFINSVSKNSSFIIADFKMIDQDFDPKLPRFLIEIDPNINPIVMMDSINTPWLTTNLVSNGDFKHNLSFWGHSENSGIETTLSNFNGKKCALVSRDKGDMGGWSLYYKGRNFDFKANNTYQIEFKLKLVQTDEIPFNVGYWVDEGYGYMIDLLLDIDTLSSGWLGVKANYTFKSDHNNIMFPINSQIDNSSFYITDISLINLTNQQYQVDSIAQASKRNYRPDRFTERVSRWAYGLDIWKTNYNLFNKLFGKGFGFLGWYGSEFLDDPDLPDWPHNPIITVLLYSGIAGLIIYLYLVVKVIRLYLKYWNEAGIAFAGFLITFFFTFFSGSHPFDPPTMGFFMLLPFLIDSVQKRKHASSL
jgi:hypothetical protein